MTDRALHRTWPALQAAVPMIPLGDFPTPVHALDGVAQQIGRKGAPLWVKRDDMSSHRYGGNKVRTLEVLFGAARANGATHIYSTGAYGSNHSVATVAHAGVAGLTPGVIAFPQPAAPPAVENLRALLSFSPRIATIPHWSLLPIAMSSARRRHVGQGQRASVMAPGGATPVGALGYVSAALELAEQVAAGELPEPAEIVVAIGSACTTAGLMVGLYHAARMGLGFTHVPLVRAVRVTPWPVTSRFRIVRLAAQTARLLATLAGDDSLLIPSSELRQGLLVVPGYLGWGYGRITHGGLCAIRDFRVAGGPALDSCYSGKSAAHLLDRCREGLQDPVLFWATKSTTQLPTPTAFQVRSAPQGMQRWLKRAEAR